MLQQLVGLNSLHHVSPIDQIQVEYTFKHSIIFKPLVYMRFHFFIEGEGPSFITPERQKLPPQNATFLSLLSLFFVCLRQGLAMDSWLLSILGFSCLTPSPSQVLHYLSGCHLSWLHTATHTLLQAFVLFPS